MRSFNHKKAIQVLSYFATQEGGNINKMKAIKLVWLADRLHMMTSARTITGDSYFALKNGPVPSGTRDLLQQNDFLDDESLELSKANFEVENLNFKVTKQFERTELSDSDLITLENVYAKYGNLNQFDLVELSHTFPEWKQYESALNKKISLRFDIDTADFFLEPPANTLMAEVAPEIVKGSKEIFDSHRSIANFLK